MYVSIVIFEVLSNEPRAPFTLSKQSTEPHPQPQKLTCWVADLLFLLSMYDTICPSHSIFNYILSDFVITSIFLKFIFA